jgi:hypothetical protein
MPSAIVLPRRHREEKGVNMKAAATKSNQRVKLTVSIINDAVIPPGEAEIKLWDGAVTGLYLRCFASGSRSWVYRYRADGGGRLAKVRTIKLGSWPTLSIDAARSATRAHAGLVAGGHDPAAVRHEKRRREKATLGMLLAVNGPYEQSLKKRGIVGVKDIMSRLRR